MSTPSEPPAGSIKAAPVTELERLQADLNKAAADLRAIRIQASKSWAIHDVLLYGGSYLTLWLSSVPAGAGWDVLIAAAPPALSALLRQINGKPL
jgi:hypothetical protein